MTKSQAYKYSEMFELMSDPEALFMLSVLEHKKEPIKLEDLADQADSSVSEARMHLERFEDRSIVRQTTHNGDDYYEFTETSLADLVEVILNRIY